MSSQTTHPSNQTPVGHPAIQISQEGQDSRTPAKPVSEARRTFLCKLADQVAEFLYLKQGTHTSAVIADALNSNVADVEAAIMFEYGFGNSHRICAASKGWWTHRCITGFPSQNLRFKPEPTQPAIETPNRPFNPTSLLQAVVQVLKEWERTHISMWMDLEVLKVKLPFAVSDYYLLDTLKKVGGQPDSGFERREVCSPNMDVKHQFRYRPPINFHVVDKVLQRLGEEHPGEWFVLSDIMAEFSAQYTHEEISGLLEQAAKAVNCSVLRKATDEGEEAQYASAGSISRAKMGASPEPPVTVGNGKGRVGDTHDDRLKALENEVFCKGPCNSSIEELFGRVRALENTPKSEGVREMIRSLNTSVESINQRLKALEMQPCIDGLATRVDTLESKQSTDTSHITLLLTRLAAAEKQLTELKEKVCPGVFVPNPVKPVDTRTDDELAHAMVGWEMLHEERIWASDETVAEGVGSTTFRVRRVRAMGLTWPIRQALKQALKKAGAK